MKRTLSLLLAFVMVLGLAACGGNTAQETTAATTAAASEEAGIYTPGTYTGTAAGKNGDVKVEVTFSANAIESVKVVEHSETAGISDGAIENIPTAIVDNQSLAVDTVSGATITSEAILNAVADAVAQAGGDVDALKNATVEAGEKEAKVLAAMNLHRAAGPEEVANGVLFLASDAASFVQGENLNCDGGMLMNG